MVGTNVGAGRFERAERIAWVGAGIAAGVTAAIGLTGAIAPWLWLGMFSADPSVLITGAMYLWIVGPFYGFFGLGLALYFASQGAGRLLWPLIGGFLRLTAAAVGGYVATRWLGFGLPAVFVAMSLGFVCMALTNSLAVYFGAWRRGR
jgi:Na+-driven multidrug efflux pump